MPLKLCLTCSRPSAQSRCALHRTNNARGYGKAHRDSRKRAMELAPYCWKCGCSNCKLEWHHVEPLYGGRNPDTDDRRQLLCKKCHDSVKEM